MKRPMSEAAQAALDKQNETFDDWTGTCRRCGELVKGSLKTIREHNCGTNS